MRAAMKGARLRYVQSLTPIRRAGVVDLRPGYNMGSIGT